MVCKRPLERLSMSLFDLIFSRVYSIETECGEQVIRFAGVLNVILKPFDYPSHRIFVRRVTLEV